MKRRRRVTRRRRTGIEQPPTRCPECGYSFTGLPPDHPCPECGFPRGANVMVARPFGPPPFKWHAIPMAVVFVGRRAAGFFVASAMVLGTFLSPSQAALWAALATGGIVAAILYTLYRPSNYAAVTPNGLYVRQGGGTRRVPWHEFRYIGRHGLVRTVFAEGGQPYRISLIGIFSSQADFDRFDEAVEEAVERHRVDAGQAAQQI